eukprot:TRINITY_DN13774_c0_g1_i1.p1 TRINITY_DN13774_c0_g1~~TRINITY_DN13774_c0_g1_i1.p1  ORF type:complete len:1451 (+),score=388.30 TRINITY_DN13774_c0_g1_i1:36-4388(+)
MIHLKTQISHYIADLQYKESCVKRIILDESLEIRFTGFEHANPILYTNCLNNVYSRYNFIDCQDICHFDETGAFLCTLKPIIAGPYIYYLEYDTPEGRIASPTFRFVVDPIANDKMVVTSMLPKQMGALQDWNTHFTLCQEAGATAIHLSPVCELGLSQSAYSLADHLNIDKKYCGDWDMLGDVADSARADGLLLIQDVVLNHMAANAPILSLHPEFGYSMTNSPHLKQAFALDEMIQQLCGGGITDKQNNISLKSMNREIDHVWFRDGVELKPSLKGMNINNSEDIDKVIAEIEKAYEMCRIWEFYVLDVAQIVSNVLKCLEGLKTIVEIDRVCFDIDTLVHRFEQGIKHGYGRFSTTIDCLHIVENLFNDIEGEATIAQPHLLRETVKKALETMNIGRYEKYNSDKESALNAIRATMQYRYLDLDGPRYGHPIGPDHPLCDPYFTRVDTKHGVCPLVNNGWIMGLNIAEVPDFAAYLPHNFFGRREVIIWGDCVKLNYGQSFSHNPTLWEYMRCYVQLTIKYFDGFRIDNAHSTSLNVGEYLIDSAREVRPNMYLFAELFSGNQDTDKIYVETLGINSLVRETIFATTTEQLSSIIYSTGGPPTGSLEPFASSYCKQSNLPSILYDMTHDNPTAFEKGGVQHCMVLSAVISSAATCSIGTIRHMNDLLPHEVSVVTEKRKYFKYHQNENFVRFRKALFDFHRSIFEEGCVEIHSHQNGDFLSVTRLNPVTDEGYAFIIRTAFGEPFTFVKHESNLKNLYIPGNASNVVFHAVPVEKEKADWKYNTQYLNGLESLNIDFDQPINIKLEGEGRNLGTLIDTSKWLPGEIGILKITSSKRPKLPNLTLNLSTEVITKLLYGAKSEGYEIYRFHDIEPVYHGIAGWYLLLKDLITRGEMGGSVMDNLRQGPWAYDFVIGIVKEANCKELLPVIEGLKHAREVPAYLGPRNLWIVVKYCYNQLTKDFFKKLPDWINKSPTISAVSLMHMQLISSDKSMIAGTDIPSMSAGLPHFASDWARCWGRDTYLALPGLCLATGKFATARQILLGGAAVEYRGLIPNLIDEGRNPRYNARDATWFYLRALMMYIRCAPNGKSILKEKVPECMDSYITSHVGMTVEDVVQSIMQNHANGIVFREHNAGPKIDCRMKHEGFDISIKLKSNGLLYGGSSHNCGTWMDKMGESERFGTNGLPATPRDGAPIEVSAALAYVLRELIRFYDAGIYKNDGVITGHGKKSFHEWFSRICESWETTYWIPLSPAADKLYNIDKNFVSVRGYYRDTSGSSSGYSDYQLRCNVSVAMAIAPFLFNSTHAYQHLHLARQKLLIGCMPGMRSLSPDDWSYRSHYENSIDGPDRESARGWNYHQGPAWLWPSFMHGLAEFLLGDEKVCDELCLSAARHIEMSHWGGLAELLQGDGTKCHDSCETQAWSGATLLELEWHRQGNCGDILDLNPSI